MYLQYVGNLKLVQILTFLFSVLKGSGLSSKRCTINLTLCNNLAREKKVTKKVMIIFKKIIYRKVERNFSSNKDFLKFLFIYICLFTYLSRQGISWITLCRPGQPQIHKILPTSNLSSIGIRKCAQPHLADNGIFNNVKVVRCIMEACSKGMEHS